MSLRSPRTPSFNREGFRPLDAYIDNNNNMSNQDNAIPLAQMQTRSSSTGARKQSDRFSSDLRTTKTMQDDEKRGLFKRKVGGKRKIKKVVTRTNTDGEEVTQNWLGRFYDNVVNFSVVTKYLIYVAPIALLLAAPVVVYAILDNSHAQDDQFYFLTTGVRVCWFWLWIEIVWLSLWIAKLVAQSIPWVFMFLCGVVSSGTRKYATILKALEMPLSFVGWAVTSLVTFTALTAKSLNPQQSVPAPHWISVMKNLLAPALIASIIFLIERLLIQLLSISYHSRSFDGKIRQSKRSIHLIGHLYDASRALFPMYCPEFVDEDYVISDSIEAMMLKGDGHKRSGSVTPLKLIGEVGRMGDKVTSVFGNMAHEITGKQVFNPTSAHSIVVEALEKTRSSEALAKRLWMSFVVEGKDALYPEDIIEVLGPALRDEADEAFAALDNDGNGDISLDEMILKIVEISRERKSIAHSMRDVGQAIGVLDQVAVAVLFVIIVFIFVSFQNTNFLTTLATAGTTLLSLSFVFATSVQEFLGSCIFLFVKHPFDVGDRTDIDGKAMVVEQISLLYTVFKRIDTMKMVQVPNIVLNSLWVENITRSKAMKEQLDMFISFDTSLEDIELLRLEMQKFVRHQDNSRDFQPDIILEATGIGNMDKLQLQVQILHKSNWHNETVRAARRSKFMCALVLALRKVPIYGPGGGGEPLGGPTNPGYSVSISDSWAAEARAKAGDAKEGKRLVPTKPKSPVSGAGESNAAEALNARRPTMDAGRDDDRDTRKEKVVGAEEDVEESKRISDINNLREGLVKRQSTRGRRQPGASVPVESSLSHPGFNVTPASPNQQAFVRNQTMRQSFDEEAEIDMRQPLSSSPYTAGQYGSYNIFPPPQTQQQQQFTAYTGSQVQPPQQQEPPRKKSVGSRSQPPQL